MPGRTAIGLDIGTSGVRAAELSYGKGGITLEKFGQVALPEGAVRDGEVVDRQIVSEALRTLWKGSGFKSRKVALGVANQRVVVRQVDLPWMPARELKSSLPLQVQDYLPLPVADCVIDFHPVAELRENGSRTLRGLLVAAAREMVMSNVDAASAAGLQVASVDLTPFAVLRSVGSSFGPAATEALIDIGARVTNLVIHSGGAPRFVRILLSGGQDVTDAIAERLGVPMDVAEAVKRQTESVEEAEEERAATAVQLMSEVFVDEIRTSIDYYSASNPQFRVERVVVTGGGSLLAGVVEGLSSATRLEVVAGNPIAPLHLGSTGLDESQLLQIQPLAAVPVGLALGAIA
ncbi:type IV pilus assembly protein PilM [Paenibacillus sp. TRM 82003]|uniref:type IV pilus assembly protein PilM n=1 Tax=Kineococcus sp. TRM81007 TaxID=2925831 RepID=UPI001F560F2A|nr:type IV pilus assembly protein PilM [Kineococcus sp. TRM81007]MCI2239010.1 type IV pilus assembly protein PilM [Kineococcus sp. TRM81007]MCI3924430.1 type IV pilus assembly protein PilM [Paenibacillus sp. TRM 82003]